MSIARRLPPRGHVKPIEEKHRQCARDVLRKGKSVYESLVKAGYSVKQAKKGLQRIKQSHALRTAFQEETAKLEKERAAAPLLPDSWNAKEQLIVNRLVKNIRAGKDGGALSAKLLGSHKALNLWTPDFRTGVIILNAPGAVAPVDVAAELPPIDDLEPVSGDCLLEGKPFDQR